MMPRDMSRTALLDALETFDLDRIRTLLRSEPELNDWRDEKGLNLLQICCSRSTVDDPAAARRQLQVARWLVSQGFDPRAIHTTAAGEDGEEDPAEVSLALFAVARARNNALARYFLEQGAPHRARCLRRRGRGTGTSLADLVRHGADVNEVVGAPPLLMAVDVVQRGTEGKPKLARARMETIRLLRRFQQPAARAITRCSDRPSQRCGYHRASR
jgi:hypothetical protein